MSGAGRLALVSAVGLWAGATLVLSHLRWFARRPLAERLRPYTPGAATVGRPGLLSVESFRDVVGPLSRQLGARLSSLLGVGEDLALRLERIHSRLDVTSFRIRQAGAMLGGLAAGGLLTIAVRPPPALGVLFVLGAPLLVFLLEEQRVANASAQWQRRIALELPVVAEQLAMLLGAGYSLGAGLARLAARGRGACATDLAQVCGRIRQGLSEVDALREWAAVARVDPLDRLVAVLALNREAGDLSRLLAEEARAIRRDTHRRLIETIERRGQQVWVPVTVATLVPGVIFLAIPFIEALRLFSNS